ncbi:uncharacterized protein [Macrobrachium rosenbergii]|uniref:uncharacterized protein n=1 Tax=Macrobrachium rosenbergii TaxID=79674 RepID=UPI0034D6D3E6
MQQEQTLSTLAYSTMSPQDSPPIQDELYADGDLILYGARVIVPAALCRHTLSRLHDSHRGVESTKCWARQAVFWPGINSDIVPQLELASHTRTDGGPLFTSNKFRDFMEQWGVRHGVTSPYYLQSNSDAEAVVKSTNHLILTTIPSGNIDCKEFDRGLLELRNIPNFTGCSPAQILYGRPLRSCIPAHLESFSKEWQVKTEDCHHRAAACAEQVKTQYDQRARLLPRLTVGQHVRIQDPISHRWDKVRVVMSFGRSRDCEIQLPSGHVWWQNHRFLRPVPPPSVDPSPLSPMAPCLDQEKQSLADIPLMSQRRSQRLTEKVHSRRPSEELSELAVCEVGDTGAYEASHDQERLKKIRDLE